ncbi:glycosyltransferase family 2 protein [Pontibacter sp. H249]|uniref:glycosyltransferase family 2 protein n=1 Tax=Pontibacter sp. H249 TaxID=3133420 RepID=UPI0030C24E01
MINEPLVYIVLVNYKTWQDTLECLNSLFHLSYVNFKVVVVDNNSANGSVEQIRDWSNSEYTLPIQEEVYKSQFIKPELVNKTITCQHIHADNLDQANPGNYDLLVVDSEKNLGFAGGNNIGIRIALNNQADYVWLLNNDTVVEQDTLSKLVKYFRRKRHNKEALGILGSKLLYYHNPDTVQALLGRYKPLSATTEHLGLHSKDRHHTSFPTIQKNDYVVGASMFVSTDFIKEVGLMAENYFIYFEELDWVKRGQKYGYTIDVCINSKVYHKEGASIGGSLKDNNNKSELSDFYSIRNRILITKKYYKRYLPSVYFSLIFVVANRIKRRQFDRLPMILKLIAKSIYKPHN